MNQKSFKQLMLRVIVVVAILILLPLLGITIDSPIFLFVFAGAFWISMLVDCLQRKENDFLINGHHEKLIWILTLVFLNALGAALYFALVRMSSENKTEIEEFSEKRNTV